MTVTPPPPARSQLRRGNVQLTGTQPLAERLALRIETGRGGHAFPQQSFDHEVDRAEISLGFGAGGGGRRPPPLVVGTGPDADVRGTAFVAAARAGDPSQRSLDRRSGRSRRIVRRYVRRYVAQCRLVSCSVRCLVR